MLVQNRYLIPNFHTNTLISNHFKCLPAEMAAETVIRIKVYCLSHPQDQGNIVKYSSSAFTPVISKSGL